MGRKQVTISLAYGGAWERLQEACRETGMGPSEICREIVEIYLDKWLQAQRAKLNELKRQGINIEQSTIIRSSIIAGNEVTIGEPKKRRKKRPDKKNP